ncbi:MAG: endo-alpha-N-acetylgalactosaminidase family protein [Flavobacteriales bacterium]|jgi:endo-alpha-N-acetylgalactosaminidase
MTKQFIYLLIASILPLITFSQSTAYTSISSSELVLTVDSEFPLIKQYKLLKNNAILNGNISNNKIVLINGIEFSPEVTTSVTENAISYTMSLEDIKVLLRVKIEVLDDIVDLKFIEIKEDGDFKIHTIAFPEQELLTISSNEKNANFSGAKMYTAIGDNEGDVFQKLNKKTVLDSVAQGFLYGILSKQDLSASIWTNAVEEKTDNNRILKKTYKKNKVIYTSLWSGSWVYRADKMSLASQLPQLKIILTDDTNDDRKVDWQDGAIAFRNIMNNPFGAERVKDWVVFRIPMNFASQATNPFSKSLDETKRIFLNTDGLGQFVILKGYGGEGHDSNHPDYGYIGTRQGGVEEMNLICDKANDYNADIGVHINGTESYPEARMFSESLVVKEKLGWNWLDKSYRIDKRYDAIDHKRFNRLKSLKDQVPNLDFIYLDVWYARGSWDSRKVASEINSLDLILATEFPQDLEYDAVWNHWAVDSKYGGKNIKGFNSKIVRFIRNHQKDTWIADHPFLGGAKMVDYEGWQGRVNYDNCIDITFQTNLPTKYIQHFPIIKWEENTIQLENNVIIKMESEKRIIEKDGKLIYNDNAYLLPWNPMEESKLYHWNEKGGTTDWSLPKSWDGVTSIFMYELSDLGKILNNEIKVNNDSLKISAKAKTPYVIYKKPQTNIQIDFGEGTLVKNGGFNTGNIDHWETNNEQAEALRDSLGQYALYIDQSNEDITISQLLPNLPKGSYAAEVYVQTAANRKATLSVESSTSINENYTTHSLWENYIAADSKHGSKMQKMFVFFDVEKNNDDIKLILNTSQGDSIVIYDDIRVIKAHKKTAIDSIYFQENFEHIPSGLFPFVKGEAGGANDPRVHLAEKHSPYTQKGWDKKKVDDVLNGNWSLKLHEDAIGLIIQTIPQNLRFEPNKKYKVSFKYQTESDGYSFVLGNNTNILFENKVNQVQDTKLFEFVFTASPSGNSWFGIKKTNNDTSDFILDDLTIIELE